MPNGRPLALQLYEEGVQKINSFLSSTCNARRLSTNEVHAYSGRSLTDGWELLIETGISIRRVQILIDGGFPFALPRFFLVDRPEFLTWPHIEEDGLLCLLADSKAARFGHPAEMVGDLLGDAYRLVCSSENGENQSDFRSEFYSYWNRGLEADSEKILSLLTPGGRSRLVQIWRGETQLIVGESQQQILSWLRRRYGMQPQFDTTDTACLLWLPEVLLPTQYPKTAGDLYRLAATAERGKEILQQFTHLGTGPFYLILGAESGSGPCFAGVKIRRVSNPDIRGRRIDHSIDGFRPGKLPKFLATQRLFSDVNPSSRIRVERVDSAWIHGRGHDPHHESLSMQKVVIIGCGSVGAPIAQHLAMAGVGHLHLVDPEKLSWANVGRHPLGAEHVGENKAEALAQRLQLNYPHSEIRGFNLSYTEFQARETPLLMDADLIVCATADWEMESLLNLQHAHGEIAAPVLYAWTEPHACAGHAVFLPSTSPCFQCGMTLQGEACAAVTVWPKTTGTRTEPACGAVFQPYGPIELQGTISLAASLALDGMLGRIKRAVHRVWAGPRLQVLEARGDWSEAWRNGHPEREKGGMQEDWQWKKDDLCSVCGGNIIRAASPSELEIPSNVSLLPPMSSTT
jgi:sulfur-carrier protein adenylyltransferase/sulfurtransferase